MARLLTRRRERLGRTGDRLAGGLVDRLRSAERRVVTARARLTPALRRVVDVPGEKLARLAAQLHALSPVAVLGRGYALPRDLSGRVLRRAADFTAGTRFQLTVADGRVAARVEE
jgi:exodeoxyribonuclease VII large subunit